MDTGWQVHYSRLQRMQWLGYRVEAATNGMEWRVRQCGIMTQGEEIPQCQGSGLVFRVNPLLYGFPWAISERAMNHNTIGQIKKRIKRQIRMVMQTCVDTALTRWSLRCKSNSWVCGQLSKFPKQLWAHQNMLTDYQVWVNYRMAAQQLNLDYAGANDIIVCPQDGNCRSETETITNIGWKCNRAQAFCTKVVTQWLGYEYKGDGTYLQRLSYSADTSSSRTATQGKNSNDIWPVKVGIRRSIGTSMVGNMQCWPRSPMECRNQVVYE
ncbi:hypothetical protein JG687_00012060 [Phytophthora cactorum]|uniref:Uncharacterized protein n=1 Tax=Phytophthora cactorum TaxID=29920 RepID=A0A8T1U438_9STRA|nr:hypothetical protein JG687_00012060 [Phytophthora cactorum]